MVKINIGGTNKMGQSRLTSSENKDLPDFLGKLAGNYSNDESSKVIIFDMAIKGSDKKFKKFVESTKNIELIDDYSEQLAELFVSRSAQLYRAQKEVKQNSIIDLITGHYSGLPSWRVGSWVYYPWSNKLVHVLEKSLFNEVQTIRNKNLITAEEQRKFADFKIGFAGMSVGSNAAIATTIQGGARQLKLADNAVISASNLNRIITGVHNVGKIKSVVMARQLLEASPYLDLHRVEDNISKANIEQFFTKPWKLDLVVDEVDDLEIKVMLRVEARKRRLPVVMVTDLGDDVMLDVERYDLEDNLPLFHGLAGNIDEVVSQRTLTHREWLRYATTIINTKNVPIKMQKSLLEIGTKIVTQPQLGGTAMSAGAAVAYAIRKIANGEDLKSGRSISSFDRDFLKSGKSLKKKNIHRKHTKSVQRTLDAM